MSIKPYLKAVVGGLVAGLTTLGTALVDDTVTTSEWVGVVSAVVAGIALVYVTPNKTPDAETTDLPS